MGWLKTYAAAAATSDRLPADEHVSLLAAGLFGEVGSVLSEMKKHARERDAYPLYLEALQEEIGDLLWYFVRLADVACPELIRELDAELIASEVEVVTSPLAMASAAGEVARCVSGNDDPALAMRSLWPHILRATSAARMPISEICVQNLQKVSSRWPAPERRIYGPLYDDHEDVPTEERLPRELEVEFIEKGTGRRPFVLLRCNGLNFGDRLTDNIADRDGYRFHDCFHFAYAAFLGWSPVMRSLLRAKRKSLPDKDENEDGARAIIIEEAVAATVFARAKRLAFYDGLNTVDYVLLKRIQDFVRGYEVETRPLWQWEEAILAGYRTFRLLNANHGGRVCIDINRHTLDYIAPRRP